MHKAFISYHHANDQKRADYLKKQYGNDVFIDRSLGQPFPDYMSDEEILAKIRQDYLKDSTVTVVLVGSETYKRKWVDWEIYASLRPYGERTRNGLLGIRLPGATTLPARLQDNVDSGYAVLMDWENISWQLENKIDEAFYNRDFTSLIDNTRPLRHRNG